MADSLWASLPYRTKRLLITSVAAACVAGSLIWVRTGDAALSGGIFLTVLVVGSAVAYIAGRTHT